jgi:K(+)-stimulated pyrophosphate-energized sodium pump
MNMVSLLAIVPIIATRETDYFWVLYVVGAVCVLGVAWAVWRSKTESKEFREMESDLAGSADASKSLEAVGAK